MAFININTVSFAQEMNMYMFFEIDTKNLLISLVSLNDYR